MGQSEVIAFLPDGARVTRALHPSETAYPNSVIELKQSQAMGGEYPGNCAQAAISTVTQI
jgi:hypothetical protein